MPPSNHPAAPVLEAVNIGIADSADCEAVKANFDIVSRPHGTGANKSGSTRPEERGLESHHVLQNKVMEQLGICKKSGWAVLLDGAKGGVHKQINRLQKKRNCPGPGPGTFGELVKASRDDLAEALKAHKADDGTPMNDQEAALAADCLIAEAVEEAQDERDRGGQDKLEATTSVEPVDRCMAAGTLIWLDDKRRHKVESVRAGLLVEAPQGDEMVLRCDTCVNVLVEVRLSMGVVTLSPVDRVRLVDGRFIPVGRLKRGHLLDSAMGPQRVEDIRILEGRHSVYSFGLSEDSECRVGASGVWIELPYLGPAVSGHIQADLVSLEWRNHA